MYRILTASKDTYITDKIISQIRVTSANLGQAGTMDLYKLYNETYLPSGSYSGSAPIELSRGLIQFDYSALQHLTASVLDITTGSFQAFISMKDVYGGQTVPSNFTLQVLPLSKSFNEGRGHDVIAYRDVDSANWLTASQTPSLVTWSQPGASATGSLGEDVDAIVSASFTSGSFVSLVAQQTFTRGDEDLLIDVTQLVSASLVGLLPNDGFRLSFISSEEEDGITRFVKRFGTTNAFNKDIRPKLIIKYDDAISDPGSNPSFNKSENLFVYNSIRGVHQNFFSGSTELTGNNILNLQLIASKSVKTAVTAFSPSHSASITYTSRSFSFISRSFSGSQYQIGNLSQTGIYYSPVNLSLVTDTELRDFVGNAESFEFEARWRTSDTTVLLAKNYLNFQKIQGDFSNAMQQNIIVNITNLQEEYNKEEIARLRVFASDLNQDIPAFKLPTVLRSVVIPDMRWRLRNAYTRKIIIPFDPTTKMSTDQDGMYFDFFFEDLDVNQVYEFEFQIKNTFGRDNTITNRGFKFKLIP